MSEALYKLGGLRFWNEREILLREQATTRLAMFVREKLLSINLAWQFQRVEGPLLMPRSYISPSYDADDIFMLSAKLGEDDAALRPETTASSYLYAKYLLKSGTAKLPLCVWQSGKSFRREQNDGASASKLRYNEFYQLEFQCIYKTDTKADYRAHIIGSLASELLAILVLPTRAVPSDRLPAYSTKTDDIEARKYDKWHEIASISTRTDFSDDCLVLELAIGTDRLIALSGETP